MKSRAFALIAIFSLSSCAPMVYIEPMETAAVVAVDIVPVPPAEEKQMIIQPIAEYPNYIFSATTKRVHGINGGEVVPVDLMDDEGNALRFDDFFVKDGLAHFAVRYVTEGPAIPDTDPVQHEAVEVVDYYTQAGDHLLKVTESEYGTAPASIHILFDEAPFKVTKDVYDGSDISTVHRVALREGWAKIDGAVKVADGLYFSVPETLQTRLLGVYFWGESGSKVRVMPDGRIW